MGCGGGEVGEARRGVEWSVGAVVGVRDCVVRTSEGQRGGFGERRKPKIICN